MAMHPDESKAEYNRIGGDPGHWLERAEGLRFGARTLMDAFCKLMNSRPTNFSRVQELGSFHSTMLLLGLALENLCKGVRLAKDPKQLAEEGGRYVWKGEKTHDLLKLASHLCKLEQNERDLLQKLTEAVVWMGKYPIPLNSDIYHASKSPANLHMLSTEDFKIADRLFDKIKGKLPPPKKDRAFD